MHAHELLNESLLGPVKWLTYTLSSGQVIKFLKKVAGHSFPGLRGEKEWPATFFIFAHA